MVSSFVLAALAAAQAAAPQSSGAVQWVPLQQANTAPAPVAAPPIAAPATTNAILRVGTEVPLRLQHQLTTKGKQLRVGHRFCDVIGDARQSRLVPALGVAHGDAVSERAVLLDDSLVPPPERHIMAAKSDEIFSP